jgi:hypothetical protein
MVGCLFCLETNCGFCPWVEPPFPLNSLTNLGAGSTDQEGSWARTRSADDLAGPFQNADDLPIGIGQDQSILGRPDGNQDSALLK